MVLQREAERWSEATKQRYASGGGFMASNENIEAN